MNKLYYTLIGLCISTFVNCQSFPQPGATWIFDMGSNAIWVDAMAQKWEYVADSVAGNGTIKKMRVTTKTVNPDWVPNDTTIVQLAYKYFLFSGDTIRDIEFPDAIIANFSLEVGDSTYSPYYHPNNLALLSSGNCSHLDSALLWQKGIVTETGIDTQDGVNSAYYKLKFYTEIGDMIEARFSQRSIITQGNWYYEPYMFFCNIIFESAPLHFVCYYDDTFTTGPCPEVSWFENLSVSEEDKIGILVYPNPVSELLSIYNPYGTSLNAYITDIHGRKIKTGILLKASNHNTVNVSDFSSGIYVLNILLGNGECMQEKFVIAR